MTKSPLAWAVCNSFEDFCAKIPDRLIEPAGEPQCLAQFIEAWVSSGEGVRVCLGNYHVYLLGLVHILDRWVDDPGITDYDRDPGGDSASTFVERRVKSLFGDARYLERILDRYWFDACVFERASVQSDAS